MYQLLLISPHTLCLRIFSRTTRFSHHHLHIFSGAYPHFKARTESWYTSGNMSKGQRTIPYNKPPFSILEWPFSIAVSWNGKTNRKPKDYPTKRQPYNSVSWFWIKNWTFWIERTQLNLVFHISPNKVKGHDMWNTYSPSTLQSWGGSEQPKI